MMIRIIPRTIRRVRCANSSTSCSNPPGNMLEAVSEIELLTPLMNPLVTPVSPSPIPVPISVAMTPNTPPEDDDDDVLDVPVELLPLLLELEELLDPELLLPKRSVTRPEKMSVSPEPRKFPMSEKMSVMMLPPDEVVLFAGVVVVLVELDVELDAGVVVVAVVVLGVVVVAMSHHRRL